MVVDSSSLVRSLRSLIDRYIDRSCAGVGNLNAGVARCGGGASVPRVFENCDVSTRGGVMFWPRHCSNLARDGIGCLDDLCVASVQRGSRGVLLYQARRDATVKPSEASQAMQASTLAIARRGRRALGAGALAEMIAGGAGTRGRGGVGVPGAERQRVRRAVGLWTGTPKACGGRGPKMWGKGIM
ncbi:hypothetical protein BV25DRAFT_610080 [Artomyces pyxidatus]|uniref:Uncharacterized protein n=1 Tax=Artomyces pyxidatus TaxID=48021 RepID=A0ACB8T3J9_9AGAM|nr:hypothetical protein BV25DRAFT_610080 [Artomyces pyxidatus]